MVLCSEPVWEPYLTSNNLDLLRFHDHSGVSHRSALHPSNVCVPLDLIDLLLSFLRLVSFFLWWFYLYLRESLFTSSAYDSGKVSYRCWLCVKPCFSYDNLPDDKKKTIVGRSSKLSINNCGQIVQTVKICNGFDYSLLIQNTVSLALKNLVCIILQ